MEIQYSSIIAVVVGWGLAQFSSISKARAEKRRRLNQTLLHLDLLLSDLNEYSKASDQVVLPEDKEFATERAGLHGFLHGRELADDIDKYSEYLCYVSSGLAKEYTVLIRDAYWVLRRTLKNSAACLKIYDELSCIRLCGLRLMIWQVERLMVKVSIRCGPVTCFRLVKRFGLKKSYKLFCNQFESDFLYEIREVFVQLNESKAEASKDLKQYIEDSLHDHLKKEKKLEEC
ncbi:hypothetical protein [Halodesulfovibrio marinisediminis]|uniref:Uncharacterized protein n=1 Tax=Halodesulfovibrio marinisediminis DSM 17456 TaxID=1121457 RepID=A0A1N6DQL9_9BACT|nr:hypothetical protein [Halodesulfovibrio marinisediminis]SIN73102.1 hypothetical protein SAMN02745161_0399 [Halodesulfovibrio marinisediminis DSM 17456]